MEENQQKQKFVCPGDCHECRGKNVIEKRTQWLYCAAQRSHDALLMVRRMEESVSKMVGTIEELKVKIEAIQAGEAFVLEPDNMEEKSGTPILPTAQEGSGAT